MTIAQTDRFSNIGDERYQLLVDSQDVMAVMESIGFPKWYQADITAVLVLVGEGEYTDVWLSESSAPYMLDAEYHNQAYYEVQS